MMNLFRNRCDGNAPKFILEEDFNTAFRKNLQNKAIMIKVISVNEREHSFCGCFLDNISE